MYTQKTTEIAKLRAYRSEVEALYREAMARRDFERVKMLGESRRRVTRALLLKEEFECKPAAQSPDSFLSQEERTQVPPAFSQAFAHDGED